MLVRNKFVTISVNKDRMLVLEIMNVKNTLILIFSCFFIGNAGHAFDLDETVDDEIRKNYNPTKLVDDVGIKETALEKNIKSEPLEPLPALPNITKQGATTKTSDVKSNTITPPKQNYIPYQGGNIKVRKGTSFPVVSSMAISDWQTKGTRVKFSSKSNIYKKKYTIPAGTVFQGEIIESHQPQISGNGGLVVIRVSSMLYKGQIVPIKAYITRADDKKIFLNNIKGDRTYLKTMWKKGNWGRTLFNKMMTLTVNLGGDGSTLILAPFPIAYGTLCLGLNTLTSPICAFFSKGGHVKIPAGSEFRIKLLEDTFIN